jgi:hypothetical protein
LFDDLNVILKSEFFILGQKMAINKRISQSSARSAKLWIIF